MKKIIITLTCFLIFGLVFGQTDNFATLKFFSKKESSKCDTEIKVGNQFPFSVKPNEIAIFKLNSLGKIIISFNQCGPIEQHGVVKDLKINFEAGKTYYFYIINGMFKPEWISQIDELEFNKLSAKAKTTLNVEEDMDDPIKK